MSTDLTGQTAGTAEVSVGPEVTVAVCTYRGGPGIAGTLDRLAAQTAGPRMRLLVIDDGSADGTAEFCRARDVDVVVHPQNKGLAAARNTALAHADTRYVAFTDDDCEPEPGWVDNLLAAVERHPQAAAWGGPAPAVSQDGLLARYLTLSDPLSPLENDLAAGDGPVYRLLRYLSRSAAEPATGERDVYSLAGANMMVRRDVVLAAGGFDERFRFGGEEEDLFRRLAQDGARVVFTPDAVVGHRFENTLSDLVRRSRAYGRGNARMRAKHRQITPTVYPAPFLVAGLLGLALAGPRRLRPLALAGAAAAPQALFSRWPRRAAAERDPALLTYPYLSLLQEAAGNYGWIDFWRKESRVFAERGPR